MESTGNYPASAQLTQAHLKFFCGPGGEGQGQDVLGHIASHRDPVGNPVGNGPGLAGTGTS